ncbi:MAG: hypothetical protein HRU46_11000 [Verrucomicrobiales bacterium]|nr:hypothetical protein [Verrucomicrobiales bacterium]
MRLPQFHAATYVSIRPNPRISNDRIAINKGPPLDHRTGPDSPIGTNFYTGAYPSRWLKNHRRMNRSFSAQPNSLRSFSHGELSNEFWVLKRLFEKLVIRKMDISGKCRWKIM